MKSSKSPGFSCRYQNMPVVASLTELVQGLLWSALSRLVGDSAVKDRGMCRQGDFNRSGRPDVLVCPQVAQRVTWGQQTEIAPGVMNSSCCVADVEDGDVGASAGLRPRSPNNKVVGSDDGMIVPGVLIDRDNLGVGEQRCGPVIRQQQIAAHDQRRTEDGPEGQQGTLLVMAQASLTWLAPASRRSQTADRPHVGIGPMAGLRDTGPQGCTGKLVFHALREILAAVPEVPDVVRDAPHLRVLEHFIALVDGSRAGRKDQDHGAD